MIAFEMLLEATAACFSWATQIYEKSGYMSYYIGIIIISIVFYKIIAPMMRGAGSDRADRRRSRKDNSDG